MSAEFFLDTNVLVYSFDAGAPDKQARAHALIARALEGAGAISFQVVQEFSNVATRRFARPMTADQLGAYLDGVLAPLCQVHSDIDLYREALTARARWRFAFYDCLIVAAALRAGCHTLYSEDLPHGQRLGPLVVIDPFRSGER